MDTMEYRRFDILKDTLSDYADLTSEIVYIQDKVSLNISFLLHKTLITKFIKWSAFIRVELEKYNVEEEIQNCISNHGTGSHVPSKFYLNLHVFALISSIFLFLHITF
jgi:hypothetical protein